MKPSSTSSPSPFHVHGHLGAISHPNQWQLMTAHPEERHVGARSSPSSEGKRYQGYKPPSPYGGVCHGIMEAPYNPHQRGGSLLTGGDARIKHYGPGPAHYQHTFQGRPRAPYLHACLCGECFPEDLRRSVIEKPQRERLDSYLSTFDHSHQCCPRSHPHARQMMRDSRSGEFTRHHDFETVAAQNKRTPVPLSTACFRVEPRNLSGASASVIQEGLRHGNTMMKRSVYGGSQGQTLGLRCFDDCCRTERNKLVAVRFYEPMEESKGTMESAGPSAIPASRPEQVVGDSNDRYHWIHEAFRDSNDRHHWINEAVRRDTLPTSHREINASHPVMAHSFSRCERNPNTPYSLASFRNQGRLLISVSPTDQNISRSQTLSTEDAVLDDCELHFSRRPLHPSSDITPVISHGYHRPKYYSDPNEGTIGHKKSTSGGNRCQVLHVVHRIPRQKSTEVHVSQKTETNNGGKASVICSHATSLPLRHPESDRTIRNPKIPRYEDKQDQRGCCEPLIANRKGGKPSPDESSRRQASPQENKTPDGDDQEIKEGRTQRISQEDDAELPLLQEHLRVLLWALLGSERLEAAATASGGRAGPSGPKGTARWCQTPVEDLLRAILGACDCPECRRRQHFRALAFEFLNQCPPLSERLAGDPRDLGAVVASVYHNDLMPSIRRHEAEFPEGVRHTVTRVARLELFLQRAPRTSKRWDPQIEDERESQVEMYPTTKMVKEEQPMFCHSRIMQNTNKEIQYISKEESQAARQHTSKTIETCPSEYKKVPPTTHSRNNLHPHHQFLLEGIKSSFQHHHSTDSTHTISDVVVEEIKDSEHSLQPNELKDSANESTGNYHHFERMDKEQIIKRKRGRPPKYSIGNSKEEKHGPVKRERRTVLWKFLLKLLDGEGQTNAGDTTNSIQSHNEDCTDCCLHSFHQQPRAHKQGKSNLNADSENLTEETPHTVKLEKLKTHSKSRGLELIATPTSTLNLPTSSPNSPCIKWICQQEGLFQILDSTKLARFWGQSNKNPNMTYEKLSRALRTYYQQNILMPVPRSYNLPKKLVYKLNPELLKSNI